MSANLSCIFCKILKAEIPATRVFETDQAIAFLDINPVNKGHLLLVPRDHYPDLPSLPASLSSHLGECLPRLSRALLQATRADGLNIIANVGPVAGQTIDHLHWHLIPRHHNDAVHWPWPHLTYQADELTHLQALITRALDSQAP